MGNIAVYNRHNLMLLGGLTFLFLHSTECTEGLNHRAHMNSMNDDDGSPIAPPLKYKYLLPTGVILDVRPKPGSYFVEIAATRGVTIEAHSKAALTIYKMLRHMPLDIYRRTSQNTRVGVFTIHEDPTVFQELSEYRDEPKCRGSCSGECGHTCTPDGRKYSSLAGMGGRRTAILEDNLLCTDRDPYRGTKNILVHEFAHSIHIYGLGFKEKIKITHAYNNALKHGLWTAESYAMSDEREYFAEATASFFGAEDSSSTNYYEPTGGMTKCGDADDPCATERQTRQNLRLKDPRLFHILSYVYTNGHPRIPGNIRPCV